jgi:hypothetical protein
MLKKAAGLVLLSRRGFMDVKEYVSPLRSLQSGRPAFL